MCGVDLSETIINLDEARALVEKNPSLYREKVVSLISKKKIEGIRFGRCFINDEEVQKMLHDILGDETLDLAVRIQALYEVLIEQETPNNLKEYWLDFLVRNHLKFKSMCEKLYSLENEDAKSTYHKKLNDKKIPQTPANKKWVYFIELVALFRDDKKVANIINEQVSKSYDLFLKQAGKKCLEFLKTE